MNLGNHSQVNTINIWGCSIKADFFPFSFNREPDLITKLLPNVAPALRAGIKVICSEEDRRNFAFEHIIAQPDCVLAQNNYLLCVEYKSLANSKNQKHDSDNWVKQIRLKDVLQCVIASMQVSAVEKKPVVCLLRYVNSIYTIVPSRALCEFILERAPHAKAYKNERRYISCSDLADMLETDIKKKFPLEGSEQRSLKGQEKHKKMFT